MSSVSGPSKLTSLVPTGIYQAISQFGVDYTFMSLKLLSTVAVVTR